MKKLITKLLIIAAIVGGYDWLVSPYPLTHEYEPGLWVLLGWAFVVVPLVYLTWRLDWVRPAPVQQWIVVDEDTQVEDAACLTIYSGKLATRWPGQLTICGPKVERANSQWQSHIVSRPATLSPKR